MQSTSLENIKNAKELRGTPPKEIHFVWIGGPIPKEYLLTVNRLAVIAKKSGYTVNLWVDDKRNYQETLKNLGFNIPKSDLKIKDVDDLTEGMKNDPFYQHEGRKKYFNYCMEREGVGFKNLAAATDFLKYEILRQKGGYYFDADTTFQYTDEVLLEKIQETRSELKEIRKKLNDNPNDSTLQKKVDDMTKKEKNQVKAYRTFVHQHKNTLWEDSINLQLANKELPLGFQVNGQFRFGTSDCDGIGIKLKEQNVSIRNDAIISTPHHPALEFTILTAMQNFKELDQPLATTKTLEEIGLSTKQTNLGHQLTTMDVKRFPFGSTGVSGERSLYTITSSGPSALRKGICEFWNHARKKFGETDQLTLLNSMSISTQYESRILSNVFDNPNLTITCRSDQNWLLKKNKGESDEQMRKRIQQEMKNKTRLGFFELESSHPAKQSGKRVLLSHQRSSSKKSR